MEAFRFYEIAAKLSAGTITGHFIEAEGVLHPSAAASDLPLIDTWKINDEVSGAEIHLALHGNIHARRLTPINFDPAHRLLKLYGALACVRAGVIMHGLEKNHFFKYADDLEINIAADVLTERERTNVFIEGFLGTGRNLDQTQRSSLATIAGIDPHASEEELHRLIREWYANAGEWTTRIAHFSHIAGNFLRVENGVEKSKLSKGDECHLVREPYNPVDPNAVMVMHHSGRKLGYLRCATVAYLAPIMDIGVVFRANVCAFLSDEFPIDSRVYLSIERLGASK